MGCLRSKSKIPNEEPGRLLLNTGIKEFDSSFQTCESAIKILKECKEKLDYQISEFIRYLGAEKHFMTAIDMNEATRMLLTVLSVECKGNFEKIHVVYTPEQPFIEVQSNDLRRSTRKMLRAFHELTEMMKIIPERLEKLHGVDALVSLVDKFPSQIADRAEANEFSTQDKLTSIRATTSNHRKITSLPTQKKEIDAKVREYKEQIRDACESAQIPPESDKLVARGVQGGAEGLRSPKDIVAKFWPIKMTYDN